MILLDANGFLGANRILNIVANGNKSCNFVANAIRSLHVVVNSSGSHDFVAYANRVEIAKI